MKIFIGITDLKPYPSFQGIFLTLWANSSLLNALRPVALTLPMDSYVSFHGSTSLVSQPMRHLLFPAAALYTLKTKASMEI